MSDTVYNYRQAIPVAAMMERHEGYPFCANPDCELHVRAGAEGVMGWGNWAELPDGRIVGRALYVGLFLCDRCRRDWQAVIAVAPDGRLARLRA